VNRTRCAIHWPPRSPDLAPSDFFFWGHDHLYVGEKTYNSVENLKAAITEEYPRINCYQLAGIRKNLFV
jgi:hypothetical protein